MRDFQHSISRQTTVMSLSNSSSAAMASFHVKPAAFCRPNSHTPAVSAVSSSNPTNPTPSNGTAPKNPTTSPLPGRRAAVATGPLLLAAAVALSHAPIANAAAGAEGLAWGTHSFIKEKYFQPGLSPEEAAARIRQTAEGMRELRYMLDATAWRYVLFYIRQKSAYLSSDLQNALAALPASDKARRKAYVGAANELVDNIAQLDRYVRTPKIYESHVYYDKTLKSLDDVVQLLGA